MNRSITKVIHCSFTLHAFITKLLFDQLAGTLSIVNHFLKFNYHSTAQSSDMERLDYYGLIVHIRVVAVVDICSNFGRITVFDVLSGW